MSTGAVDRRQRWVLGAVSVAQLMVVLDATITSIALPSAQSALHFNGNLRQWVVTAYALAFGSLLLPGGRLGDLFGRKRTFITGLLGFAGASTVGGLASTFAVLVAARALQGAFAALLAPAALALLTTTFREPAQRAHAFGVFGTIASAGSGLGVLLGGVLTGLASWRWAFYVNLAFAVPAALIATRVLPPSRREGPASLDIPGAATVIVGLLAIIDGLSSSEARGWSDSRTIAPLAGGGVLVLAFAVWQRHARHPLLPPAIVSDRTRGGAFLSAALAGSAIFGVFLFLTYYLQQARGDSPLLTGLLFLPLPATIMVSARRVNAHLLGRWGARRLITIGMILGVAAMAWLTRLTSHSPYAAAILPALILLGLAMAGIMAPAMATATAGVQPSEAGAAAALVNTMQQVGGALGTAVLSSIYAAALGAPHVTGPLQPATASIHADTVAFWVAAGLFATGALLSATLIRPASPDAPNRASAARRRARGADARSAGVISRDAAPRPEGRRSGSVPPAPRSCQTSAASGLRTEQPPLQRSEDRARRGQASSGL
jgi:EmrB/QacA subfamily drug resistance transporter